jgi:hypothetical protein
VHLALRATAATAMAAVGLLAFATPAQAHALHYGDDASNWVSTVTAVRPTGAVRAVMGDGVQRITVSLGSAKKVVVDGYDDEPFVLLRTGGAWVNNRSKTWYAIRGSKVSAPSTADNSAAPVWQRVSDTASWSWHDVRTHWPGYTLPPPVEADPNKRQPVLDWRIGLRADGSAGAIIGTLDWVPGPSGGDGAAIAAGTFALIAALWLVTRRTGVIALALGLLVVVDGVHSAGMIAGRVGGLGNKLAALPGHGGLPLVLWLLAIATAVLMRRRREMALYSAAMLAALFCFTEALPSLGVLWHSQAVNSLPMAANRALIAVLTGASVAIVLAAVAAIVRTNRPTPGGPA